MALIPLPQPPMRESPSAGSHLAAGQSLIHLGTQPYEFEGKSGARPQIRLGFELMDEFMSDGRPFLIARTYNYSLHPNAALRADLEGWRGRPFRPEEFGNFDLAELIGRTAVVGIKHETGRNGTVYAGLPTVMKPPLGTPPSYKLVNKPVVLSFTKFDTEVYQSLPDWLRKRIAAAPEYQRAMRGGSIAPEQLAERLQQELAAPLPQQQKEKTGDLDDEIPF